MSNELFKNLFAVGIVLLTFTALLKYGISPLFTPRRIFVKEDLYQNWEDLISLAITRSATPENIECCKKMIEHFDIWFSGQLPREIHTATVERLWNLHDTKAGVLTTAPATT